MSSICIWVRNALGLWYRERRTADSNLNFVCIFFPYPKSRAASLTNSTYYARYHPTSTPGQWLMSQCSLSCPTRRSLVSNPAQLTSKGLECSFAFSSGCARLGGIFYPKDPHIFMVLPIHVLSNAMRLLLMVQQELCYKQVKYVFHQYSFTSYLG